ncbi:gp477 [Bacillus phage G]|uniref:Gp477 n=1 Tax=Bacillus phage G TaxID=2884420 RepID=G3MAL8_9CAUD|nr:gp477 [Bacillus phage G]AEO93735.1 gp477 [Bacillus phage G]
MDRIREYIDSEIVGCALMGNFPEYKCNYLYCSSNLSLNVWIGEIFYFEISEDREGGYIVSPNMWNLKTYVKMRYMADEIRVDTEEEVMNIARHFLRLKGERVV